MAAGDVRLPMRGAALVVLLVLVLAGRAWSAPSVTVGDASSALAAYSPTSGMDGVAYTTSDRMRFSNDGADQRELMVLVPSWSYQIVDGSVATTSVSFQGTTRPLRELVFLAQASSASFLPVEIRTGTDLTGQAGWTKSSSCGTVGYQGSFSIASYSNAGVAQTPLVRYYQVCDSTEIYVDTDIDLSSGADFAYVATTATSTLSTNEADYELVLSGTDYAFASAGSATTVTLQQGKYLPNPILNGVSYVDAYPLYALPDGVPAGCLTTTITATAYDISL